MKFLSVCSGIDAASVAWNPLGWKAVAFSEIEPFPCSLLAHHYPDVPNWGDMNNYEEWPDVAIDLLCGGTPCQSFSVAGLRGGLDDERGNLMLTFAAIARKYRPRWVVWENVPGVLSSNEGRDFGSLLGLFSGRAVEVPSGGWQNSGVVPGIESAYGLAWRVLDAQYFGVPQRRRRVFLVGYLGDWRRAAAVLLERHSLQGNPAPRRQARQGIAAGALRSTDGGSDVDHARAAHLIPETVGALTDGAHNGGGLNGQDAYTGRIFPVAVPLLEVGKRAGPAADDPRAGLGIGNEGDPMFTLQAGAQHGVAFTGDGVNADPISASEGKTYTHEGSTFRVHNCVGVDAIAFSAKDHGGDATVECSPTLRSGAHDGSHANGGVMPAVAFPSPAIPPKQWEPPPGYEADDGRPHFRCRSCARCYGYDDYERNPTCPECGSMDCDDLDQEAAEAIDALAFAENSRSEVRLEGGDGNRTGALTSGGGKPGQGVPMVFQERGREDGRRLEVGGDVAYALTAPKDDGRAQERNVMTPAMQVRRLTPRECERLQGFKDDYTLVPHRGKEAADGPRYKSLGNSWAVPVIRWIGTRIDAVEALP